MDKSENTIRDKGRKKKLGWIGENDAGQREAGCECETDKVYSVTYYLLN